MDCLIGGPFQIFSRLRHRKKFLYCNSVTEKSRWKKENKKTRRNRKRKLACDDAGQCNKTHSLGNVRAGYRRDIANVLVTVKWRQSPTVCVACTTTKHLSMGEREVWALGRMNTKKVPHPPEPAWAPTGTKTTVHRGALLRENKIDTTRGWYDYFRLLHNRLSCDDWPTYHRTISP